jgi:hypothetical protein
VVPQLPVVNFDLSEIVKDQRQSKSVGPILGKKTYSKFRMPEPSKKTTLENRSGSKCEAQTSTQCEVSDYQQPYQRKNLLSQEVSKLLIQNKKQQSLSWAMNQIRKPILIDKCSISTESVRSYLKYRRKVDKEFRSQLEGSIARWIES